MPNHEAKVLVLSNNDHLEKVLLENQYHADIKFVRNSTEKSSYYLVVIDLKSELTHVSQTLISTYNLCRENNSKLVVVLLHQEKIDIEKNHYFQNILDNLGQNNPLHRLVLTKDLYQKQISSPITSLDEILFRSLSTKTIKITQKGENLLFPLSLNDFVSALVKIFFLSATAGKTFWILGDPLTDLELAYLLKKEYENINEDTFEIDAKESNYVSLAYLQQLTNRAKIELNWNTEDDFGRDLNQIVGRYFENPAPLSTEPTIKNQIFSAINHLIQRFQKPQPKSQLLTINKIVKKLAILVIISNLLLVCSSVFFTALSLTELRQAIKESLLGNIQKSKSNLNISQNASEIGEFGYRFYEPVISLISSKESAKINNVYSLINYSLNSLTNLQQTYQLTETLYQSLGVGLSSSDYENLGTALHSNLSQVYENLNQIKFLTATGKLPSFVSETIKKSEISQNLDTVESQVVQFISFSNIFPKVLAGEQVKNFVVISQNSRISKSNGGQINDILVISLEQGRLVAKNIYSPQDIANLTTNVDPKTKKTVTPPVFSLFSGYETNPNYPQAAQSISEILEKSLKIKPDFVIAINDSLFSSLLEHDQNFEINSRKILPETYKSELQLPSSSRFLTEMLEKSTDKLLTHQISLPVLGKVLAEELNTNQILLWSSDDNFQKQIHSQNYSGAIIPHFCHSGLRSAIPCVSDTFYLNESLVATGSSKIWESRKVSHLVTFGLNSLQQEYQIDYVIPKTNSSSIGSEIEYQVFLPTGYLLDRLYLNHLPASTTKVEKQSSSFFDLYKIKINLLGDSDQVVNLVFNKKIDPALALPVSYSLTEYQQPGMGKQGTSLKITYPAGFKVGVVSSPVNSNPDSTDLLLSPKTTTFGLTFSFSGIQLEN